jgi:hypothetical protein
MTLSTACDPIRSAVVAGVAAALLLVTSASIAQPATKAETKVTTKDRAAAEALFKDARDLVKAGDWAAGCPKFEASLALSASASAMLNIAKCHEHDRKLATAWADYSRALTLNDDTEGLERRAELEALAKQGLAALEPRLPKLRIVVTTPAPGLTVRRDGQELPAAALGEALPADPGPHEVSVAAPGRRPETRSATLEEGKTTTLEIALLPATDPVAPTRAASLRPAGIALLAVGVVGLGAGVATGIVSLDKVSAVKASCHGVSCLSSDQADRSSVTTATTLGNVSTASFVAGGALAAAGVVLVVLRSGPEPSTTSTTGWGVTLGPGRVALQGRF